MRNLDYCIMAVASCVLVGCQSSPPPQRVPYSNLFNEQEIYASLKSEPVPAPRSTPYEADARRRQVFIDGFRQGWNDAISGAFLHATFGTPSGLANDLGEAWSAGWKAGIEIGIERWKMERERLRGGKAEP